MRFSGFPFLAGIVSGVAASHIGDDAAIWSLFFIGAGILVFIGAIFEASN